MPITRKFRRSGMIRHDHNNYFLDQSFISKKKEIQHPIKEGKSKSLNKLIKVSKQLFQKLINTI